LQERCVPPFVDTGKENKGMDTDNQDIAGDQSIFAHHELEEKAFRPREKEDSSRRWYRETENRRIANYLSN
jgi:hypothetical protein